jgi:hypothetical protein
MVAEITNKRRLAYYSDGKKTSNLLRLPRILFPGVSKDIASVVEGKISFQNMTEYNFYSIHKASSLFQSE